MSAREHEVVQVWCVSPAAAGLLVISGRLMSTKGDETRTSSLWKMTLSEGDAPKRRHTRTTTIWPLTDNIVSRSAPLCPPSPGNVGNTHFSECRRRASDGFQRVSPGGGEITQERQRRPNKKDAEVLWLHYCCYYYERLPLESHGSLGRCLTLLLKKILSAYLNYPMMQCASPGSNIFHDDGAPLH